MVVPAGGAQIRSFNVPSGRPLLVEVQGVANADKGFSVYLIDRDQWEAFKARKRINHYPSFEGKKVIRFRKKGTVPAGSYGVVVANTENLLMKMTVEVKIVADPE